MDLLEQLGELIPGDWGTRHGFILLRINNIDEVNTLIDRDVPKMLWICFDFYYDVDGDPVIRIQHPERLINYFMNGGYNQLDMIPLTYEQFETVIDRSPYRTVDLGVTGLVFTMYENQDLRKFFPPELIEMLDQVNYTVTLPAD